MKKLAYLLTLTSTMFAAVTGWNTPTIVNGSVSGSPTSPFYTAIDASGNAVTLFKSGTTLNASTNGIITDIATGTTLDVPLGVAVGSTGSFMSIWNVDSTAIIHARPFTFAGTLGTRTQISGSSNIVDDPPPQIAADPAGNFLAAWTTDDGGGSVTYEARYYTASSTTWGSIITVSNDDTYESIGIASDGLGTFLTAWRSDEGNFNSRFITGGSTVHK